MPERELEGGVVPERELEGGVVPERELEGGVVPEREREVYFSLSETLFRVSPRKLSKPIRTSNFNKKKGEYK